MRKIISIVVLILVGVFAFSACATGTAPSAASKENDSRNKTYTSLTDSQPAHSMSYSPTRATKNFWIDTWNKPGKLAYVYLVNANGDASSYFITVGPPVTYCSSLVPPYQKIKIDLGDYGGEAVVPAPSVDGTFSSGADCSRLYGKDAVSGTYVEFTVGMGQSLRMFDRQVPQYGDAKPGAFATFTKVK